MASNQQHWELIKMPTIDDTDTAEFSLLDLENKNELDHLMEFGINGGDSAVSSGGDAGRSVEGGGVTTGSGEGSNVLGGAASIAMSFGVSGGGGSSNHPNVSLLSGSASTSPYDTLMLNDQKPQIRHDCMWAGVCADQSHPEKHSGGGGCGGCARQNLLQHQQQQQSSLGSGAGNLAPVPSKDGSKIVASGEQAEETVVIARGGIAYRTPGSVLASRPAAPGSVSCPPAVQPKSYYKSVSLLTPFKATQSANQIPAGSSLLIKRQQQQLSTVMLAQNCRQLPPSPPASSSSSESGTSSSEGGGSSDAGEQSFRMVRVPHLPRGSFLAAREQEARSIAAQNHARPDTPLSLDDDPLEFKHNLDLVATCTIGSNQQSLLHTASSSSSLATASVCSSSSSSFTNSTTTTTTPTTAGSIGASASGVESRTGAFYGRLGGSCSCGGISSSNNVSSIGHTTQCYFNYLQDTNSVDDMRNKQLREQLLMLDDPYGVLPNHLHQHHHHHHHHNVGHQHPQLLRPDSPDNQLEQLLIDLREIEGSSCLLDDQHTTASANHSVGMKDGASSLSPASSLHHQQHHHQHQQHHHHQQQHQQQQRSPLSLAPCGGELSGGAHATCNKECYWSSLELPHPLASPGSERRRRHQFAHRRRSVTVRGWMSDDDEDEEEDLLKQLEEEDDFFEKHFEPNGVSVGTAAGNAVATRAGYQNTSSWEDEEEEDEEEDEEESGEEDKDEQEEDEEDEEEVDEDEDEDEEEDDANEESMYGDGSSSSRSRSRARTSRHRYHHQYNHHRRVARSYRPYDVEVYNGKHQKKQSASNGLSSSGGVNTIIVGSGASLKSSMLGAKLSSTSCNGSTNGTLNSSTVTSAASQSTGGTGANSYQATHFGDHSYTRPKGGYNMNELGVQTPSDSDEEIDVVSVGDKNLPTNPTERDMRHMQSEVASKIRTASSRSAGNGTLPYGTGSSHHHYHQRPHHLADGQRLHHHHHSLGGIYPTPAGSTTISGANTPLPTRSGGASVASSPPPSCTTTSSSSSSGGTSRKRPVGGSSSSGKRSSNASKRMRLAHAKRGGGDSSNGGGGGRYEPAAKALAEELDTVEKRNLHNNLERQRRIGLKNLFEELKRQIPQLRDKDRAPKVNILREAAALCTRLNHETEQVNELRQQQMKLYERVRYLRASIHSQQRLGME